MKTEHYKLIARVGYFLLLLLVPLWHLWLSPPAFGLSPWLIFTIWFVPLLFPLKGVIQGNPFTFAWCGFLALLYMMHAVVILYTAYLDSHFIELTMAALELIFATVFLMGNIYFAKYRGQELGLSIRKKKKK
ncbi:DUF2069 domain-containing protein [Psychromonas sp. Urea-02u-13]|uniref:DUF2069 domain-containing protein n=1 Tax=Psychromonas sp. Urea-02u-13 TaxID=2058326 RepID=UPI000C34C902|nr:DUF2069 domain-containing protein [Psychromonas sp. Urea-02u-13]PKG40312.1 DUF2069 domain-containing protein [Psychromonas sp. Urea-02u-13]